MTGKQRILPLVGCLNSRYGLQYPQGVRLMYEIDNEKFGVFLVLLRKQKGFTQKQLAQKLFISDKAVSKWERGLSMPDISLFTPLAGLLGVTITELLSGQRIEEPESLNIQEVEKLVTGTIEISEKEKQQRRRQRRRYSLGYFICAAVSVLECALLYGLGYSLNELSENIFIIELLFLLFGAWLCLFAKETLPAYYDENKISFYTDGVFRMNIAGVHFNNSNWPHILRVGRLWILAVLVLFPLLYLAVSHFFPAVWAAGRLYFILLASLGVFVPMVYAGKRYE